MSSIAKKDTAFFLAPVPAIGVYPLLGTCCLFCTTMPCPKPPFFGQKAIPALHKHVEGNISLMLEHVLSDRVHMITDMWPSKNGQGHYISFMDGWINFLASREDAGEGTLIVL